MNGSSSEQLDGGAVGSVARLRIKKKKPTFSHETVLEVFFLILSMYD
jgi:hypothetical protein